MPGIGDQEGRGRSALRLASAVAGDPDQSRVAVGLGLRRPEETSSTAGVERHAARQQRPRIAAIKRQLHIYRRLRRIETCSSPSDRYRLADLHLLQTIG